MYVDLGAISWRPDTPEPDVLAMQSGINQALQAKGCRKIGEDGRLGPETCGAIKYANAQKLNVDAVTLATMGEALPVCQSSSYSCQVSAPAPVPTTSTEAAPVQRASISTANLIMAATGLAAVAVVGYAVAKKKGWIK